MLRRAHAVPTTATEAESTKMAKVASTLLSAMAWHSPTKAIHWARSVACDVAGSRPAPIDPGSKNATIDDSEDFPGPHVPGIWGLGIATRRPVTANATPKSARNTMINLNPTCREGSATCDPLSTTFDDMPVRRARDA